MRKKRGRKVNSRFRLAAADMDGTLLNQERKITKRTQEVIKQVIEQGVYFVPATGRAVNALPVELRSIKESDMESSVMEALFMIFRKRGQSIQIILILKGLWN